MKHRRNNSNKGLTIALGVCIALLSAVIIFMLVFLIGSRGDAKPTEDPGQVFPGVAGDSPELPNYIVPEATAAEDVKISTPYVDLTYPGDWGGLLQVDQIDGDPYQVIFTAALDYGITQELFTIGFGGSVMDSIGVIDVSGKQVPVQLTVQDIAPGSDWTANEISIIYAMQECLNDVLAGLELTTPQEEPRDDQAVLPPESEDIMTIDTPAGDLRYPARWKDFLKLEVLQEDVYTLEFYTVLEGFEPVHLFNVYLGGDQGIHVVDLTAPDGSLVKLYVDIFEIEADINWTDAEKAIVFAMQEDINFLLSELN